MISKKTNCPGSNHPNFIIESTDKLLEQDVRWLLNHLENQVLAGISFEGGERIQIGCGLVKIFEHPEGLTLFEPDYQSFPINWVEGVFNTLTLLRSQKDFVEQHEGDIQINFPSILDSAIVGIDLSPAADCLIMERSEANGRDSGWFVGDLKTELDYSSASNLK